MIPYWRGRDGTIGREKNAEEEEDGTQRMDVSGPAWTLSPAEDLPASFVSAIGTPPSNASTRSSPAPVGEMCICGSSFVGGWILRELAASLWDQVADHSELVDVDFVFSSGERLGLHKRFRPRHECPTHTGMCGAFSESPASHAHDTPFPLVQRLERPQQGVCGHVPVPDEGGDRVEGLCGGCAGVCLCRRHALSLHGEPTHPRRHQRRREGHMEYR